MDDLLVVGGGPVGLVTALYARRAGLSVSVLERRTGPVDKACGEGLMPQAVAALTGLGLGTALAQAGRQLDGITYVSGRREVTTRFSAGPGLGVRRTRLAALLLEATGREGIPVHRGTATGVVQDHREAVVLLRDGGARTAHYVVAADGLHSPLRHGLGLDVPSGTASEARRGLRRHVRVAPWSSTVEVHWGDVAEAYVTPIGPDEVGVAVLTRERAGLDELLLGFPRLQERLGDAPATSTVRGAAALRQASTRRVLGRVLLVGDAAGYVDALTGEGIALGVLQARAAVAALAAGRPTQYEGAWRALSRRPDALTAGLLRATRHRWGRRLLVPAASAVPWVFGAVVDSLAGSSGDLPPETAPDTAPHTAPTGRAGR